MKNHLQEGKFKRVYTIGVLLYCSEEEDAVHLGTNEEGFSTIQMVRMMSNANTLSTIIMAKPSNYFLAKGSYPGKKNSEGRNIE